MKKLEKYKNWIVAFVFTIAVIAVYKTFDNFYKVTEFISVILKSLTPFVIGFVIAYILNIPATKIDEWCKNRKSKFIKKQSKVISIVSVYLLLALIFYIAIRAVAPALYRNIVDLYFNIPGYMDQALTALDNFQTEYGFSLFQLDEDNILGAFDKILSKIDITEFGKYAKGVVDITSGVINAFIGIIVSVYMLIDKEKIKASLKRVLKLMLKEKRSKKVILVARRIDDIFSKYIFCLILDAVIMAVLSTIILSILNVKYAIILGIMIGVCNLIPYFGAIFAIVLSIIITLVTGGFFQALWVTILLILLQQIDGNFIGPKIMGEVLDASPLWIILAVTLGGGLFGVTGMIVSVPILISIKMAVTEFINDKEKEQSEE